jgi:tetratricopeptide (TPR) repeat protein
MRRQINFKRLACLLVVFLACATCVHFLHGFQVKRSARVLPQLADQAEEKGDLEEAVNYLNRFLAYEPSNNQAWAKYGILLGRLAEARQPLSESEYEKAFFTQSQVLIREPQRQDVRRAFVKVALKLGRYTEAQESLKLLLPRGRTPGDADLRGLQAQVYEAQGKYDLAEEACQLAIAARPDDVAGYLAYARLLRDRLGQPDGVADDVIGLVKSEKGKHIKVQDKDLVIRLDPHAMKEPVKAYLARAKYCTDHGKPAQAAQDIQQAYKLATDEPEALRAMAQLVLEQKSPPDYDKARAYLTRSVESHPQDKLSYRALARLELQAERRAEAIACLRQGLAKVPRGEQKDLLWDLATVYAGKEEDAGEAAKILKDAGFPPAHLNFFKARLLVTRGQWVKASQALEALQPQLAQARVPELETWADLLLGLCYDQLGNPDQRYAVCLRAAKRDPSSLEAFQGVASALLGMGKIDDAISAYERLIPRWPAARLEAARLLILQNQRLPSKERNWDDAETMLAQAEKELKAPADRAEVAILKAEVQAWKGDISRARAQLAKARGEQARQAKLWVASATLEDLQDDPKQALALLNDAARIIRDRVEIRLAFARYWSRHRKEAGAEKELRKQGEGWKQFNADDQKRLLRGLAEAWTDAGNLKEARSFWEKLDTPEHDDLIVWSALFDLAVQAEDEPDVKRARDRMKEIEGPDGTRWRYEEACYRVWQCGKMPAKTNEEKAELRKKLEEPHRLLEEVARKRPAWSRVAVCFGDINVLEEDFRKAVENYQRALDLGSRDTRVIKLLVQSLTEQEHYSEAELVLRKLPDEVSFSPDMQRAMADLSARKGDFDQAGEIASKALAGQSDNYLDYLWAGQILARSPTRLDEAEKAFRRAVELAPDKPETWIALVQFLAGSDPKVKAAAEVRKAEAALKDAGPRVRLLALAACYEAVGDWGRAGKLYEQAEKAAWAAPRDYATLSNVAAFYLRGGDRDRNKAEWYRNEAEKLLKLIAEARNSEEGDWARRVLPLVMTTHGDYKHAQKALEMLRLLGQGSQAAEVAVTTPAEQRTRAAVLAAQQDPRERKKAIVILENLLAKEPPTVGDRLLLAQLYDSVGDWKHAREQMLGLLAVQQGNVLYIAFCTQAMVRHQEWADAQTWLDKLQKLGGADGLFLVADSRARLLAGRDRAPDAVAVLAKYVADGKQPESPTSRRLMAAALLDELSRAYPEEKCYADAAEEQFRAYVKDVPDKLTVLAAFLGRHHRLEDALRVCEQAWEKCPPGDVAMASLTALQDGKPNAGHYLLVEGWLDTALAKDPKSKPVLVCRAYLHDVRGEHDKAAEDYERILKLDPDNAVALNNLAALLALRGEGDRALGLIERAIRASGPVSDLRDTRAMAYLAAGRFPAAIQELEEVVAEKPKPTCYFHLAQAYLKSGKKADARNNWKNALNAGLTLARLHPLEYNAFHELAEQLR